MAQDLFKEDILENAITQKQLERKERRETLRTKREEQEKRQAEAAARAKKRRKFMLLVIAVVIIAGFVFGRAVYRISELKKEKAQAEARLEELQEKLSQLEDELTRVTSDEYIEQQARTHLRMIYPGETVYIVVPPEENSGN
ncbi:MAG: septum formation initiator family protein [Firmicutes bacterium]|nr:septum formation initiator family protein [Bacillota bacterium]